jgi:hypothetical protein
LNKIKNPVSYYISCKYIYFLIAECPTEVNAKHLIAGVVVGIVVVGLAVLLIWKLFATISDRRELARFLLETNVAKWDTVSYVNVYTIIQSLIICSCGHPMLYSCLKRKLK